MDDDLIVATHGRSFWVLDDVAPLREIAAQRGEDGGAVEAGGGVAGASATTTRIRRCRRMSRRERIRRTGRLSTTRWRRNAQER